MFVKVKVIANSKQEKVEKNDNELKVHLKEKPIHGKANKKLLKILAEYFNVQKNNIVIRKGESSSIKIIEIKNK